MVTLVRNYSQTKGPARTVMLILACHADKDGYSYPGIPELVEQTGFGRDAVINGIKEAEALGELSVQRRQRKSNLYKIIIEPPVSWDFAKDTPEEFTARVERELQRA